MTVQQLEHTYYQPNVRMSDWIQDQFRPGFRGYCIDVGASDGISTNSTYCLEFHNRWTVLSIEANPYYDDKLFKTRGLHRIVAIADKNADSSPFHIHLDNLEAFSSLKPSGHAKNHHQMGDRWATTIVPVRTLDVMIQDIGFPKLDALCVDTEGTELDVLKGFNIEFWRPKVIVVETWEQGSLDHYLEPFGYERVHRSSDNDGYIYRPFGILG